MKIPLGDEHGAPAEHGAPSTESREQGARRIKYGAGSTEHQVRSSEHVARSPEPGARGRLHSPALPNARVIGSKATR